MHERELEPYLSLRR